jgi:hypothetical protein
MAERREKDGKTKRKKICYFTENKIKFIDYKDEKLLRKFVNERGKSAAEMGHFKISHKARVAGESMNFSFKLNQLPCGVLAGALSETLDGPTEGLQRAGNPLKKFLADIHLEGRVSLWAKQGMERRTWRCGRRGNELVALTDWGPQRYSLDDFQEFSGCAVRFHHTLGGSCLPGTLHH